MIPRRRHTRGRHLVLLGMLVVVLGACLPHFAAASEDEGEYCPTFKDRLKRGAEECRSAYPLDGPGGLVGTATATGSDSNGVSGLFIIGGRSMESGTEAVSNRVWFKPKAVTASESAVTSFSSWIPIGLPRLEHHSAASVAGVIFVVGGLDEHGVDSERGYYSIDGFNFVYEPDLSRQHPPRHKAATTCTSEECYMVGGRNASGHVFDGVWCVRACVRA